MEETEENGIPAAECECLDVSKDIEGRLESERNAHSDYGRNEKY